jgi:hemolysin activation/secretion protein
MTKYSIVALVLFLATVISSHAEELIPKLKGVVIIPKAEDAKAAGRPGVTGVMVEGPNFLTNEKVAAQLKGFFGKPLTEADLARLQKELVRLCRAEDHPIVDVVMPEQEIVDGVIQIVVVAAKVGSVTVENEGQKHVPDEKVLQTFNLKAGDDISAAKMAIDADWFNRHPFRTVDIGYKQGAVGTSDIILSVDDKKPWKFYSTFENTGTRALGKNQFVAGTMWALPGSRDQIMSYQYRADSHSTKLESHVLGYQYFLPSRHYVNLTGYYSDTSAAVDQLFPGMSQKGESWLGSIRYGLPLDQSPSYKPELQFGFDFKKTDSNLLYGGESVFALPTETLQFVTSYLAKTQDQYGTGAYNIDAIWSPGDLTNYNEDLDFSRSSRINSTADYLYYRAGWGRNTTLPWGLNWVAQVTAQYSEQKLPPAEQMGVGGYTSVRGYDERYVNGDSGIVVRNEIYLPAWKPLSLFGYDLESDRLRVLGFLDYGTIHLSNFEGGDEGLDDAGENFNIASYGWGIRYNLQENLAFRFDHGFQLSERHRTSSDSMAHFSLTYTY